MFLFQFRLRCFVSIEMFTDWSLEKIQKTKVHVLRIWSPNSQGNVWGRILAEIKRFAHLKVITENELITRQWRVLRRVSNFLHFHAVLGNPGSPTAQCSSGIYKLVLHFGYADVTRCYGNHLVTCKQTDISSFSIQ